MIDAVSMLLLIIAEPEAPAIRVIKMDAPLKESLEAQQEPESAADDAPRPEVLDRTLGFTAGDYPKESIQAREEGHVRIALEVDAEGKPTGCSVIQTSGHPRLDEKTCQVAMERAAFRPARDKQGNAVASTWGSPPIRWKMPSMDYASLPPSESFHATTIQIAADGTLGECTTDSSGGMTVQDACQQAKARHANNAKDAARWWKSLTDVIIMSNKDSPPNFSKPEWGIRQSRIVSARLMLSGISDPVSCETILTDGWALGGTACPPADKIAPTPLDPDWSKARTSYTEFATFGQPR